MTLSEWKAIGITQVILTEFKRRQAQLVTELAMSAGINPLDDRFKVGAIAAYEDVLNIELDEESHGD